MLRSLILGKRTNGQAPYVIGLVVKQVTADRTRITIDVSTESAVWKKGDRRETLKNRDAK